MRQITWSYRLPPLHTKYIDFVFISTFYLPNAAWMRLRLIGIKCKRSISFFKKNHLKWMQKICHENWSMTVKKNNIRMMLKVIWAIFFLSKINYKRFEPKTQVLMHPSCFFLTNLQLSFYLKDSTACRLWKLLSQKLNA